jgi:hypothetical protein
MNPVDHDRYSHIELLNLHTQLDELICYLEDNHHNATEIDSARHTFDTVDELVRAGLR